MKKLIGVTMACLTLALIASFFQPRVSLSQKRKIKAEGLWPFWVDPNFRDFGASLNSCFGQELWPEGKLLRAAGWFTGWSCDKVGKPEQIYSLDFDPNDPWYSFCLKDDGKANVGKVFFTEKSQGELSDLEFIENWEKFPEMIERYCIYLGAIWQDHLHYRKTLIHCDAGRDRTGITAAIIGGLIAEKRLGKLDDKVIAALSCDYQKSKSLTQHKYARIETFMREAVQRGSSLNGFIQAHCANFSF